MSGQREIPPPPQFGAPAPQVLQLMQPAKIEGRSKAEIIKDLDKKKNIKASVVSEGLRNKAFKRGKPPAKVSSELWKISSPLMKAKDNSYEPTNYIVAACGMGVYNKTKLTQIGRHVYGRTDNDKDNGCAECLKKLLGTLKALNEKPSTKANKSMQALGIICSNASPPAKVQKQREFNATVFKDKFTELLVKAFVERGYSINVLTTPGLKECFQYVADQVGECGHFVICEKAEAEAKGLSYWTYPHVTTAYRRVETLVKEAKANIKTIIEREKGYLATTTDTALDKVDNIDLAGLVLHFFNEDLQLQELTIACYPFKEELRAAREADNAKMIEEAKNAQIDLKEEGAGVLDDAELADVIEDFDPSDISEWSEEEEYEEAMKDKELKDAKLQEIQRKDEGKTAANIRKVYERQCAKYDLPADLIPCVLDGVRANKNALKKLFHYCACHRLNRVEVYFWLLLCQAYPSVGKRYIIMKRLVAYVKRTGNGGELEYAAKSEIKTRFNTRVHVKSSFVDNWEGFQTIARKAGRGAEFNKLSLKQAEDICDFLERVEDVSNELNPGKKPTQHKILDMYDSLYFDLCEPITEDDGENAKDDAFQLKMKELMRIALDKKLQDEFLNPDMVKASILAPTMMGPSDRLLTHWADLKTMHARELAELKKTGEEANDEVAKRRSLDDLDRAEQQAEEKKLSRSQKRKRKRKSEPSRAKRRNLNSSAVCSEFERYEKLASVIADPKSVRYDEFEQNPMQFWQENREELPELFKEAKKVFVIPASSTSCERVFSRNKRNRLEQRGNKLFTTNEDELILGSWLRMQR